MAAMTAMGGIGRLVSGSRAPSAIRCGSGVWVESSSASPLLRIFRFMRSHGSGAPEATVPGHMKPADRLGFRVMGSPCGDLPAAQSVRTGNA